MTDNRETEASKADRPHLSVAVERWARSRQSEADLRQVLEEASAASAALEADCQVSPERLQRPMTACRGTGDDPRHTCGNGDLPKPGMEGVAAACERCGVRARCDRCGWQSPAGVGPIVALVAHCQEVHWDRIGYALATAPGYSALATTRLNEVLYAAIEDEEWEAAG